MNRVPSSHSRHWFFLSNVHSISRDAMLSASPSSSLVSFGVLTLAHQRSGNIFSTVLSSTMGLFLYALNRDEWFSSNVFAMPIHTLQIYAMFAWEKGRIRWQKIKCKYLRFTHWNAWNIVTFFLIHIRIVRNEQIAEYAHRSICGESNGDRWCIDYKWICTLETFTKKEIDGQTITCSLSSPPTFNGNSIIIIAICDCNAYGFTRWRFIIERKWNLQFYQISLENNGQQMVYIKIDIF